MPLSIAPVESATRSDAGSAARPRPGETAGAAVPAAPQPTTPSVADNAAELAAHLQATMRREAMLAMIRQELAAQTRLLAAHT